MAVNANDDVTCCSFECTVQSCWSNQLRVIDDNNPKLRICGDLHYFVAGGVRRHSIGHNNFHQSLGVSLPKQ